MRRGNRGGRNTGNPQNNHGNNQNNSNNNNPHCVNNNNNNNNQLNLTKLFVKGWTNSSIACNNQDGGIQSLHQFLEKKSSRRIVNSWRNHDAYVILVNPEDSNRFTHLNGFSFAGVNITVEQQHGQNNNGQNNNAQANGQQNNQTRQNRQNQNNSNNQNNQNNQNRGGRNRDPMQVEEDATGADKVEAALVACIRRCYEPGPKFLNLSLLPKAPEIVEIGLNAQAASKVFSAIFVCCETKVFETPLKRQQMVESLSLASNGLTSVKDCISAAGTFNHIKNLDLSNNMIADVGELRYWRNRFPNLEHLVLTGNPVDNDPKTKEKMQQWYSKLKMYNGQPIAVAPEGGALKPKPATAAVELLPNDPHPEIPPGSLYGQPAEGKAGDQLMKEQMALRFSYETRLRIHPTEECLQANQFDYGKALADLQNLINRGIIQDAMLWTPRV